MEWTIVKNPRKENGDLGELKCDYCGKHTGAYVILGVYLKICKGCLEDGIDKINEAILSDVKK